MSTENNDPTVQMNRRSPLLMNRTDTAMVIVDVQEKLLPHIEGCDQLAFNIIRLIDASQVLELPVFVTEQYPKGLGKTVPELAQALDEKNTPIFEKTMFSVRECRSLFETLTASKIKNIVLVGIETHVCILQSAMDLMSEGFNVFVCIDAVGSRYEEDFMTAMQRMETAGVVLVSTEMTLFEWCEKAGSPEFKKISRIVQREFKTGPE